jgi:hypothetical protein
MQIKKLEWRSNAKELSSFFQMIGKNDDNKLQYFITRSKNDLKYCLKIINGKVLTYYFDTIKEAQEFCQSHFNSKMNDTL